MRSGNITFSACTSGSFIFREPWEGKVQSVYGSVINILHPDGILISLLKNEDQMSDLGIVIPDLFRHTRLNSLENRLAFGDSEHIVIPPDITIEYSTENIWRGNVSGCDRLPDLKRFLSVYRDLAVKDGLSPLVTGAQPNLYSRAASVILDKFQPGYLNDLSSLIGLGIGFTPSGDDFLTGVLLFEQVLGALTGVQSNFINRFSITEGLKRTTPGGRTLLFLALQKSFPFYLKKFASRLCTPCSKNDIKTVLLNTLKHGATSGSDALAGFLWIADFFR